MMRVLPLPRLLAAMLLAAPFVPVAAQSVVVGDSGAVGSLGPNADAYTLPQGGFRLSLQGEHQLFRGRWHDGVAEPLGAAFNTQQFGAARLTALTALDLAFAGLGVPGLNASLGATRLELRQRAMTTRLGVELGVFDWLTLGVDVPFVRTRSEAQLRLDGTMATAGVNPYYFSSGAADSNATIVNAYQAAVVALNMRLGDCMLDAASHPECPIILAEDAEVIDLMTGTSAFATNMGRVYGVSGVAIAQPYVPLVGSPGDLALRARAIALAQAFERYGVTDVTGATGIPLGAQAPLSAAQLAQLVDTGYAPVGFSPTGGFAARPMTRRNFQQIGDVDITAKVRLYDGLGDSTRLSIRQSVMFVYRIGSGYPDDPDDFIDLGTGSGVDALGIRSFTDVRVFRRLMGTVTLGWAQAAAHTRRLRLPSMAYSGWAAPQTFTTAITPTATLDAGIAGQWQWTDRFLLGAAWRWRGKGEDQYRITGMADDVPAASALETESAWDEQRLSWTLSYATPAAMRAGRGLPIEVGFTHEQVVGNSRGVVPQAYTDRLHVRYYTRLFGDR